MQSCLVCLYVSYYKCHFLVPFQHNFLYLFMQFIWGWVGSWLLWEFLSRHGAQDSFCGSFLAEQRLQSSQTSVVVAPRLWSTGSIVVAHELSCSAACGVFPDHGSNLCLLQCQKDSLRSPTREALLHRSCYMTVHTDVSHSFLKATYYSTEQYYPSLAYLRVWSGNPLGDPFRGPIRSKLFS